jgi:hypothetical protein
MAAEENIPTKRLLKARAWPPVGDHYEHHACDFYLRAH